MSDIRRSIGGHVSGVTHRGLTRLRGLRTMRGHLQRQGRSAVLLALLPERLLERGVPGGWLAEAGFGAFVPTAVQGTAAPPHRNPGLADRPARPGVQGRGLLLGRRLLSFAPPPRSAHGRCAGVGGGGMTQIVSTSAPPTPVLFCARSQTVWVREPAPLAGRARLRQPPSAGPACRGSLGGCRRSRLRSWGGLSMV